MSEPCDSILAQISELTGVFNTLYDSIETASANALANYQSILLQDNKGGTYPTLPLTSAGVQARITYLQGLNPEPFMLIMSYTTLASLLTSIDGMQATLAQTSTLLGGFKQQAVDNNCYQS
jgi:hypothetical protein